MQGHQGLPILVKKLLKSFTISFLFEINLLSITKLLWKVLAVELPVTFLNIFHVSLMLFLCLLRIFVYYSCLDIRNTDINLFLYFLYLCSLISFLFLMNFSKGCSSYCMH